MLPRRSLLATSGLLALLSTPAAAWQLGLSWEQRFDGKDSFEDYAGDVVVDLTGAVYTVGATFESAGGGLYVPRFVTIKYSPAGQHLWSRTFGSGFNGGMGNAQHVALRPGGGVVVGGATNGGHDWGAVAYDDAGTELWSCVWTAGSSFVSSVADMSVSATGDVFLCGDVGVGGKTQGALVRISPGGLLVWVRLLDGTDGPAHVTSVVAASGGTSLVGGARPDASGSQQMCLSARDPAGGVLWTTDVAGAGAKPFGLAHDLAIATGRIYAAGTLSSGGATGGDAAIVAFSGQGAVQWTRLHDGGAQRYDEIVRLAVDSQGGVAGTGITDSPAGDYDVLTLRVSAQGSVLWSRTHAGAQGFDDDGYDVAVGPGDDVYVVGTGYPATGGRQILALGYSAAGAPTWEDHYGGPTGDGNWGFAVATGPSGEVIVHGDSPAAGGRYDIVTLSYGAGAGGIVTYCTSKANSQGCTPAMSWSGVPSATQPTAFLVRAFQVVNNKAGLLIYTTTGRAAVPFQGGFLCLAPPIRRTPLQASGGNPPPDDCSGTFSLDFNAFVQAGSDPQLVVGALVRSQYWSRDPADAFGVGLSDALEFPIGP